MFIITKVSLLCLLFIMVFLVVQSVLHLLINKNRLRTRLSYFQKTGYSAQLNKYLEQKKIRFIYNHLSDLMEALSFNMKTGSFLTLTCLLVLTGTLIGSLIFHSPKGVIVLAVILGSTPYLSLRMRVISLQMKTRIDFLPALEIFYEHYVLSGQKNVISVLKSALQGSRIRYPMKPIFEQLQRNLSTNREIDDCLRIFSLSLGHIWSDYFTSILRFGLVEGVDVNLNLQQLITDMRKAKRADQVERNRLLEIRLANFSSVFFLIIFLAINFKINFHNSYYYYFVDVEGKSMLLDGAILIFCSFLMGLYLSVRRI